VKTIVVMLSGLALCVPGLARAQDARVASAAAALPPAGEITPLVEGLEGKISLDLRDIDIRDALKYFSLKTNMNIVTSKDVAGRVTLIVEAVTVKDVFDIMLRSNGLAYDKVGDVYNVMTQEQYRLLYGKRFADVREVRVFRLQYAVPEQAFSLLDAIKSEIGRILVDPESGSVLCMDSPENLDRLEAALREFEQKSLTKVFTLNYAKAKMVEEQLRVRLNEKKVGSIKADERGNQVIVQALPERMREVEGLIAALDKKTKQVLIDAKIVKVKLGNDSQMGVAWEGLFDVSEKYGLAYLGSTPFAAVGAATDDWRSRKQVYQDTGYVGSYPFSGTTSNYSASQPNIGKLHFGMVGSNDFDVFFNYLTTETNAKILSNPKIAVTNEQEARIHVGERQAYVTTTTTTGTSTSTISEQVNFIDLGIQMTVTPVINDEGFVSIKMKTEVSSVISFLITPSKNEIPIVDTTLAETNVLIKQGATLVIGGLRKEEKSDQVTRVPILSKIPLLGKLFQDTQKSKTTTELLILLTPTIVTGEALVAEEHEAIGESQIKSVQNYGDLERRKQEMQTYQPAPTGLGGMELKGFRAFQEPAVSRPIQTQ